MQLKEVVGSNRCGNNATRCVAYQTTKITQLTLWMKRRDEERAHISRDYESHIRVNPRRVKIPIEAILIVLKKKGDVKACFAAVVDGRAPVPQTGISTMNTTYNPHERIEAQPV